MMIRTLMSFLLIASATVAAGASDAAESRSPNVVFIMVDDLGWSDLSYNGSKVYETPNVDRLASQGMVLSDFYSGGPVCSPTRASIMTGKYTARTGITTYLPKPQTSSGPSKGLFSKRDFLYSTEDDEYECPAGERLIWRFQSVEKGQTIDKYWSAACPRCDIRSQCTTSDYRRIARWAGHLHRRLGGVRGCGHHPFN